MSQDADGQVWNNTSFVTDVGGWSTEPPAKGDAAKEPESQEERQLVDAAVAASRQYPDEESRGRLSISDKVRAFYGDFIRQNGRNPQAYKQADRQLVIRFVLAAERRGQKLNQGQIQSLVKSLSPTVARLNPGERDMYVRSLVTRIARDPQREQIRLNKDYALRITSSKTRQGQDPGTPAEQTTAVMQTYRSEGQPVKPEPPAIANEKKIYKEISAKVKSEARRENKTLEDKSKDIEVVKELKTRGHSDEQIQRVLSHSPHIKNVSGSDKDQNIKDICYQAEKELEQNRSLDERHKLWEQTLYKHRFDKDR